MKLKEFLQEMSIPVIDNIQQATETIQRAYEAAMKGPANQDVVGGLDASLQWLQQQPGLGSDANLQTLQKKALAAKRKLDSSRATKSTAQTQFTTMRGTSNWGGSGNL